MIYPGILFNLTKETKMKADKKVKNKGYSDGPARGSERNTGKKGPIKKPEKRSPAVKESKKSKASKGPYFGISKDTPV